jgi:hypothetical protein
MEADWVMGSDIIIPPMVMVGITPYTEVLFIGDMIRSILTGTHLLLSASTLDGDGRAMVTITVITDITIIVMTTTRIMKTIITIIHADRVHLI